MATAPVVVVEVLLFAAAMAGLIMITWLGIRSGDESGDLRVAVSQDQLAGIAVRIENPSAHPVVFAERTRPVSWVAARFGSPARSRPCPGRHDHLPPAGPGAPHLTPAGVRPGPARS